MTAKPDQPEPRDRALARLLAEALQPAASAEAAGRAACPDAEILAAYADQALATGPGKGLENDERERLEDHFAACGRCQEILAVLAASLGEALDEPIAGRAAVTSAPARHFSGGPAVPTSARPPARPSQRWLWWLTPAFGAAAAALLWMVLRPASPVPVQTAADYSRPGEQATDSLTAQANLPPPAAEAVAPRARTADSAAPGAKAEKQQADARNEQPSGETPSLGGGIGGGVIGTRRRDGSAQAAPTSTLGGTLSVQAPTAAPAAPAARSAIAVAEAAPPVTGTAQGVITTEQLPLVSVTGTADGPGSANFIVLYKFASPDGSVAWGVEARGNIQRSTDGGQTWQRQASGVTTDLVAGSAASNEIAWVVGRAGVILRTTDGAQWQRVAPPQGAATTDWVGVEVRDVLNATVTAADGRRFATTDAGRTWTQQQ